MVVVVAGSNRGRPRSQRIDDLVRASVFALLDEVGYNRLSIERVAQRAGVGKSTIYRRWPSKAEMVFALVMHDVELPTPVTTGSLRGDLTMVTRGVMEHFATPAARRAVPGLLADLTDDPDVLARFSRTFNASELAKLEVFLGYAVARGELATAPDPAEVHMLLVGPVFFWLFTYGREASAGYAERIADVVAAGLTAGPGGPPAGSR